MDHIIDDQIRKTIPEELIENDIKKDKIDDFFSAFEENMMKSIIFQKPSEGEDCEFCSA